jgi:uncharacterized membrane protein
MTRKEVTEPMTAARTAAEAPAKPLSPALDKTFKVGLVLKGLDGILEVAGGILLLFLSPHAIEHLVRGLTAHELSQDPHDLIARYLLHSASHLNKGVTLFGAVYLLSHGAAKIVLVALVLRDKLWAYPWLIVLLLAFIGYQVYRLSAVHFSVGLTALTLFDAALVWLTWREYQSKRGHRAPARPPEPSTPPESRAHGRPQPAVSRAPAPPEPGTGPDHRQDRDGRAVDEDGREHGDPDP